MSTASIRKPMIIKSNKSANIIADVLESRAQTTAKDLYPVSVKEIKAKSILALLRASK